MDIRRILSAAVAAILISAGASAQAVGEAQDADQYRKALRLYEKGLFSEASVLFDGVGDDTSLGYSALCHLAMGSPGCEKMAREFMDRHPESVIAPEVAFRLALRYFDTEDFATALGYFRSVSPLELLPSDRSEFAYKRAFSAFSLGNYTVAKEFFLQAADYPASAYTAPSEYSLGYIEYSRGNFSDALPWFEKAAADPRFRELASYYILECRFMEKDYQWVVDHGEAMFERVPADRQPHMARIMSESYLILGDTGKARSYYEKNQLAESPRNRADYFYAGSLLFAVNDWAGAIDNYSRMGEKRDSLGQIALYQMGYSYVETGNKVAAMGSFRDASSLDFDPVIREDAFFNYAKLAFDLNSDTSVFDEYMSRYGGKEKGDQIYSYQAMAALAKHDYEAAVEAYDNIDELDDRMKSNYRKAYFLRGEQLVSGGSWRAAIPHLRTAAYYSPRSDPFNQLARYWMAEATYRDGDYAGAREIYTDLYNLSALEGRREGYLIPFGIAYTYFSEGDYDNSRKWFERYLALPRTDFGSDAASRIGDCCFLQKDYRGAVAAYRQSIEKYSGGATSLYSTLRAGIASGLGRDPGGKLSFLERALKADPSIPWWSETMFELGRTYVSSSRTADARSVFNEIRTKSTDPDYQVRSLLELGMLDRNAGDDQGALSYFHEVVTKGTAYTEDALMAIEAIYRSRQDPDGYIKYIESVGEKAQRTDAQKESVYFNTAEQVYLSGNYEKAMTTLQGYLDNYPGGAYTAKAEFYLAESLRQSGSKEKAGDYYKKALSDGVTGSYRELSNLRLADVSYELGRYSDAYESYDRLLSSAGMEANRQAARLGMMRSAFKAHDYQSAIRAAGAVSSAKGVGEDVVRESEYVIAKSYLATSRREEAFARLERLARQPSTDEGAEASYLVIQDLYDRARYDEVEAKVYDFSAKAAGQNYWLAKAFIVLGDTFAQTGNKAQAKATYESIVSGYVPFGAEDDVQDQVASRLKRL